MTRPGSGVLEKLRRSGERGDGDGGEAAVSGASRAEHDRCTPTRPVGAFPVRRWLAEYQPSWLRPDLVAGLTLAAYLLPAGIADASLAGLPPEAGLYACLFSGLVFWLFCSSKHTVITVTSALSLLVALWYRIADPRIEQLFSTLHRLFCEHQKGC